MNFTLKAGKEIVILYKTKAKEKFDPDLETHFQLNPTFIKARMAREILDPDSEVIFKRNQENIQEHLFFDEGALKHILQIDNLIRSSIIAKRIATVEDSVSEEEKEERKDYEYDLGFERKPEKEYLEIELEQEPPQHQIDEKELMESLIGNERDQILSCEASANSCFDWVIGERSQNFFFPSFL